MSRSRKKVPGYSDRNCGAPRFWGQVRKNWKQQIQTHIHDIRDGEHEVLNFENHRAIVNAYDIRDYKFLYFNAPRTARIIVYADHPRKRFVNKWYENCNIKAARK